MSIMLILVGCGSITAEDAFEESENAMKEIESVKISFSEKKDGSKDKGKIKVDMDNDLALYELGNDIEIILRENDYITRDPDGNFHFQEEIDQSDDMKRYIEFMTNPYQVLEQLDDGIKDKFTAEKEDEEITLSFDGDEDESHDFATRLLLYLSSDDGEVTEDDVEDFMEFDLEEVKVEIVIDESNYLLKKVNYSIDLEEDGDDYSIHNKYTYDDYDKNMKIDKLVEEVEKEEAEQAKAREEEEKVFGEANIDEDEASAYLDALIQATVFQDEEGFIKAAPESMSEEDSQSEAEVQRAFFKQAYIENTQTNMEDFGVTDEEIESLADAFIDALGKTDYEVVGAEEINDHEVIVTVSVEGINETKIYQETDDELRQLIDDGKLEEEDFAEKNMEVLIDMYEEVEILDPVEVEVSVLKEADHYLVPLQDEFLLGGFVQ